MKSFILKHQLLSTFLLLCFVCIPVLLPLFHPGYFVSDDGTPLLIRFTAFHQALRDGQFPVRFLPRLNFEYGYPVADFLYPGYMYLAEILHLAGLHFIISIKALFGTYIVFSAFFTYLWLKKIFDQYAAFIGSVIYLYTPYHLYDIYKRGSLGEVLALTVVPFVLWQIERRSLLWTAVGIALLILSHNTLAAMFIPIICGYLLLRANKDGIYKNGLALILGIGGSCFFWLPALYDLQYTIFSHTNVSNWSQYFADTSLLGYIPLCLLLLAIIALFYKKKFAVAELKKYNPLFVYFLCLGILSIFLSSSVSTFIWNVLPTSFIQFPFRFLSVEILAVTFLGTLLFQSLSDLRKSIIGILGLIILMGFASPFLHVSQYNLAPDSFYSTNEDTTTVKGEYLTKWVLNRPASRPAEQVEIANATTTTTSLTSNKIALTIQAKKPTILQVNTVYFPGWEATVDNTPVAINYHNTQGTIQVPIEKGSHDVRIFFTETPLRLFSDVVSIVSLLLLLVLSQKHLFRIKK